MDNLKILHASDAFFHTKPEEYLETFLDYVDDSDADLIVLTGDMGFEELPRFRVPVIYTEGDFESITFGYTEPKQVFVSDYSVLILPHTPDKKDKEFIKQIHGEEIDIIISPAAPIDTHFLKGNRAYELLFDIAYFRSPRLWLAGHYKFFPFYQSIVPVKSSRKKFCNVFGVNTSYGYIEEITFDEKLNVKEFQLKRIFNGHGRKIF